MTANTPPTLDPLNLAVIKARHEVNTDLSHRWHVDVGLLLSEIDRLRSALDERRSDVVRYQGQVSDLEMALTFERAAINRTSAELTQARTDVERLTKELDAARTMHRWTIEDSTP